MAVADLNVRGVGLVYQPESRYVQVSDIRMHYLDWGGDGPVCVMFHGAGMCGGTWEPIVQRLEGRLHCITPDMRSHGETEGSTVPISWELLAEDVAGFLSALDLRQVVVAAHSFGAGSAIFASARISDRVAGGYFIEPTPFAQLTRTADDRERFRQAHQGVRNKRRAFRSRQEMFESIKGRGGFRFVTDESLWAYVNHGTRERSDGSVELKCTPESEAAFFDAQVDASSMWSMLARITYPVTLVYSEARYRDPLAWKQHEPIVRRFKKLVRTCFEITPGTHNTAMEHPDIHVRKVLELVDRIESEGRLPK